MSWLKPGTIPPTEYDPQKSVEGIEKKYGRLGTLVLNAFNEADPLQVFYEVNADEYRGYIGRFFMQLEGRDFQTLSDENIADLVRGSFYPSQIEKGFVDPKDLALLIQKIIQIRNASERNS